MPRKSKLAEKTLTPKAKENPWRAKSKGFDSYEKLQAEHKAKSYKGVTFERAVEIGCRASDLSWGVSHDWIEAK